MSLEEKRRIRSTVRSELTEIPLTDLQEMSGRITDRLVATAVWREAEVVLTFNSMPAEIDTSLLISRALSDGKAIGIPRVEGKRMQFYRWNGDPASLVVGTLGIREPEPDARPLVPATSRGPDRGARIGGFGSLLIVPGLAFDRRGYRIGHAGGYYDRYLAAHGRRLIAVGVCLGRFVYPTVPTESYDQGVDAVITESELLPISARFGAIESQER